MKVKSCYLFFLLLLCKPAFAQQGVRGRVTDAKGEPVGFVTIYCSEQKKSTYSNADGTYEISLPAGSHQVYFQCVGYKTQVAPVTIVSGFEMLNVQMQDQSYSLKEVSVSANGVNPAVWIMRKAIAAAPYYRRQVLMYNARAYVKGSGKLDKIPFLLRGTLKKEGITEGFTFLMESINELSFTQPNTYKEKALSVKNSFTFDGAPEPLSMVRGSMYSTNNEGVISPLSPQAFSVYNFKLEGSYYESGRAINRIKVIPKRKGKDVMSGYVYIIDGLWCLHSTDLTTESNVEAHIITSFRQVDGYDYVWMPVTYDIHVKVDFLGFKGSFRYLTSVSNYRIKLNPNLDHNWVKQKARDQQPIPVVQEENKVQQQPKLKTKRQEDIEKLLAKEQLSKWEMLKLANKMKKETDESEDHQGRDKLQVVDEDSSSMVVDSMATKRDSMYWVNNRPVALMDTEVRTYVKSDSVAARKQSDSTAKAKRDTAHKSGFDVAGIFVGMTKNFHKGKHFFRWSGITGEGSEIFLNTVDGWGASVRWQVGNKRKDAKEWVLSNTIRVPFERKALNSIGSFTYRYGPLRMASVSLEGGSYVSDFNTTGGVSSFVNNVMLIFDGRNFLKLYQQEYATISHTTEIMNGLLWKINAGIYNRYELSNIRRYEKKEGPDSKITPNEPIPSYSMPRHQAAFLHTRFTYTPQQRYKIERGRKQYVNGKLPTFDLDYTQAVPGVLGSDADYSKVSLAVTERIKPLHWLAVSTRFAAGTFIHNTRSWFPDYNHFNGNRSPVFDGDPLYTFRNLDYYAYSTTRSFATLHAELDLKRILVKRLPIINMTGIREVIFYNGLMTDRLPSYHEIGYGIDRIYAFLRVETFVGLKSNKYNKWGVRVVLNIERFK